MAYIHQINEMDFDNSFQEGGYRTENQSQLPVGAVVSIFVNFCSFHCVNCWNSKTWDRQEDLFVPDEEIADKVITALKAHKLTPELGLSLLGGDPILPQNAESTANIIRIVLDEFPDLVVGLWTGYTFEYLLKHADKNQKYILENIDVIIDGRFIEKKKIANKRYGSHNQRVINVPESLKTNSVVLTDSYVKEKDEITLDK